MKPAAWWNWLLDHTNGPYERRMTFAVGASHGLMQCARIVSTIAPAAAVENYVHTVMQGERQLERWKLAFTAGGGLMPLVFSWAGGLLGVQWPVTVAAQCAWLTLWTFVGLPWLFCTLDEQQLELRATALTAMCQTTDASQEQINRAARRLGLEQYPHDDPHP